MLTAKRRLRPPGGGDPRADAAVSGADAATADAAAAAARLAALASPGPTPSAADLLDALRALRRAVGHGAS